LCHSYNVFTAIFSNSVQVILLPVYLPYHAATAIGFGLSPEDALRAITLSPAEIFGVANRVGSIDPGKDATLFIADGDILDTPTQVVQAWIQGRSVDLSSKHTDLYEKYKTKYEQLQPK
jgi:imidazolonepropionase-like amidohydrolase